MRERVNVLVEKTHITIQNTIQKDATSIQKAIQKRLEERGIAITDLQMKTLVFFALNPTATRNDFISSDTKNNQRRHHLQYWETSRTGTVKTRRWEKRRPMDC